jgi:hypothetical protein
MSSTSYGPQRRPPLRPQADQQEPAAGRWVDGEFTFATPEAEEAWQRSAYQQAVSAKTWHLGDKIDDQTRDAILTGIGGATRPMYQGPDGQYYFQNARTLEDPSVRSHRAQHVAGKTIDQIAAAGKIPGEDEYVAMRRGLRTHANDNSKPISSDDPRDKITAFLPKPSNGENGSSKPTRDRALQNAMGSDCAEEHKQCTNLCTIARYDPDMGGIWGGSFQRCMMGCISADCGGNRVM